MAYKADCPACGQAVEGGAVCDCGYLRVTAAGRAWTQMHGAADAYRLEPNILVTEVADDPPKSGATPKRGSAGGEAALPDDPLPGDGEVERDGGADRVG